MRMMHGKFIAYNRFRVRWCDLHRTAHSMGRATSADQSGAPRAQELQQGKQRKMASGFIVNGAGGELANLRTEEGRAGEGMWLWSWDGCK